MIIWLVRELIRMEFVKISCFKEMEIGVVDVFCKREKEINKIKIELFEKNIEFKDWIVF